MSGQENDTRAFLEELEARAREGLPEGERPTEEELLDHLAGRLPAEDEERVARWVVADPEVARAAVDLADLQAAVDGAAAENAEEPRPDDLATRAAWRDLRPRLPGRRPADRRRPFLAAAAALLILLSAGLAARVLHLERQLDRPVANLTSVDLVAGTRDAGAAPEIAAAAGERLLLVLEPAERCAGYEAVLDGPDGRWTVPLVRDERGRLTLMIRGVPGEHTLTLRGCEPPRPLQEHAFRIVPPGAGGR